MGSLQHGPCGVYEVTLKSTLWLLKPPPVDMNELISSLIIHARGIDSLPTLARVGLKDS